MVTTLLLACALAQVAPPSSSPPIGVESPMIDRILADTIWPELFTDLFNNRFDLLTFWAYPLDRPFNPDAPDVYYGSNQFGQPYALTIHEIRDLGDFGHINPNVDFWGVTLEAKTVLATREVRGIIGVDRFQNPPITAFIPGAWYRDFPPDDYVGHDCKPPVVPRDFCDPLPCDLGGIKTIDPFCVGQAGNTFKTSCILAWSNYDAQIAAAEATHDACERTATAEYAICCGAAALGGFFAGPIGIMIGVAACTGRYANQTIACDDAFQIARTLAHDLRENALTAATSTFWNAVGACCVDCQPTRKPLEKQDGRPKKK